MRFMILVKSIPAFEADPTPPPNPAMMEAMGRYHDELARAGVLLDYAGLKPTRDGFRIHYGAQGRTVVDGPFTGSQDIVAGYTLIQCRSREEALEWARRYPNPVDEGRQAQIEVRPLYGAEDFT